MAFYRRFAIACVVFASMSSAPISARQTVRYSRTRPAKPSPASLFRALGVTNDNASRIEVSAPPGADLVLVKKLLAQGADVNGKSPTGLTPLQAAVRADESAAAKLLLDNGATVNLAGNMGRSALMDAAESSDASMMQLLLDHGARVNAQDKAGLTPLMFAVLNCDSRKVALLLRRHAQVNIRDRGHRTALHFAGAVRTTSPEVSRERKTIVGLLKQAGAKE